MRTDASLLPGTRDGYADLEHVRLHYVTAGDDAAPLVLMVHGFPDFWYSWRHQILPIAEAGFRVVAIDLRGYNLSDKPEGIASYGTAVVAKDLADLIDSLGAKRAHVIGHDWGAGISWAFAMAHPDRLDRLALCNGPHPENLLASMRDPVQLARSWYVFLFQIPWLSNEICKLDGFKLLLDGFRTPAVTPGKITPHDLEIYAKSYRQPGAVDAMLRYYRGAMRPSLAPKPASVEARVLSIWGVNDPHLGRELATPPAAKVPNATTEFVLDASHWVHHEQPDRVNALLLKHLT
ncbi:MAG: alpha/beta fold hydrolase [Labilithrix sp.]